MNASDAVQHRIKAAQRDLIKLCGGIERAAEISSVSKSQIGRMNDALSPDLMTLSVIIALEADCGQPVLTSVMAGLHGRRLSDPDEDRAASVSVIAAFAAKQQAVADTMAEMALSIADGVMSNNELRAVDRKLAAEQNSTNEFRASISRALAAGGARELKIVEG